MTPGCRTPHQAAESPATAGRDRRDPVALVGRAETVAELVEAVTRPLGRAVSVVVGAAGTGRSALLAGVADAITDAGHRSWLVRGTPADRAAPYRLLYRVVSSLTSLDPRHESAIPRLLGAIARTPAELHQDPTLTTRIADTLAAVLVHRVPTALLVDDAHYADQATLDLFASLATRMAGRPCGLVLAFRTGHVGHLQVPDESLCGTVTLGDLTRTDTAALVRTVVQATADPALVDAVVTATRGNPGAIVELLGTWLENGRIVLIDGHAHLLPGAPPMLAPTSATVTSIRALGEPVWRLAKTIAAFGPAGASVGTLLRCAKVAAARTAIEDSLRELARTEVIEQDPESASWRYRLPSVATTVAALAGPYERQAAVMAALDQEPDRHLDAAEEGQLANLLVEGWQVIPAADRPAAAAFLRTAADNPATGDEQSATWRRVALELRAGGDILADTVDHALRCAHESRWAEVAAVTQEIFTGGSELVAAPGLPDLLMAWTVALDALGRRDELGALAEHGHQLLPISPALRRLTGCAALVQLRRWRAAEDLLNTSEPLFAATTDIRVSAAQLRATVNLAGGLGAHPQDQGRPADASDARRIAGLLCNLGELGAAEELLTEHGLDRIALTGREHMLAAYQAGDWDSAARQARVLHAHNEAAAGAVPGLVYGHAAAMHAACGRFGAARQWISAAVSRGVPAASPCLRLVEAQIDSEVGKSDTARQALLEMLNGEDRAGHQANLDEILGTLVAIEVETGQFDAARDRLDRLGRVAEATGTGRSRLWYLRGTAQVERDPTLAAAAVALAEERQQPFEMALTYLEAAQLGLDTERLLGAAYELFGELDALVWRAKVRSAMRVAGMPALRRETTVAENERLMTTMVADGLSNRELARVMKTTAKSIEGQLTRMFARKGLRSRVELAASHSIGAVPADAY